MRLFTPDLEAPEPQGGEGLIDHRGDLGLVDDVQLAVADDVDVGLVELPEPAALGALAPVDLADLVAAEGEGELAVVKRHVLGQGHGEVKAKRQVAVTLGEAVDLLFRLAAAFGKENLRRLDGRGVQGREAVEGVGGAEDFHDPLHLELRRRQKLHKAGKGARFDGCHSLKIPFCGMGMKKDTPVPC